MEPHSIHIGQERITVGSGLLPSVPELIQAHFGKRISKFIVLSDVNVAELYARPVYTGLLALGYQSILHVIEAGEESKCRQTKAEIEDALLAQHCGRDSCLIAVGGGVIGDLGGFVASTYMRGIPLVQVPTTLLAMVDSSIGGKTGIDAPAGKNLIGSFYSSAKNFMDVDVLKTLPGREFFNGMAEVIKTAAIRDAKLFQLLDNNVEAISEKDPALLTQIVTRCATIKAEVVASDAKEGGVRAILNWGHTLGHAIEALTFPSLLHGECVAIGMVLEAKLSNWLGHLASSSIIGRLTRCIQAYKLPTVVPAYLSVDAILKKMLLDKKNAASKIRCVILTHIGATLGEDGLQAVDDVTWKQLLRPFICVKPSLANGDILVPGSKSLSNRALMMAALGKGDCRVLGLLHADDTHHMLDALDSLGAHLQWQDDGATLLVRGSEGKLTAPEKSLYLGNAGTASRFLTSACTLLPTGSATLTGHPRLKERPIKDLTDALVANGCQIKFLENEGYFPFSVQGTGLTGGNMNLSATISSQYVSSLLMSAPYAKNAVTLQLVGKAVSQPFIEMTTLLMEQQFGIKVTHDQEKNAYVVPQGVFTNPKEMAIEADASSATYPLAMAALTGGKVTVLNVGQHSLQGDAKFCQVLETMGCQVQQNAVTTTVIGPPKGTPLKAINLDFDSMTDTFMTAAVLCAVAQGESKIFGIANQRVKECNRIAAMVTELSKLGVKASELPDGLVIEGCGGDISKLNGAHIECYKDHRIAMSFATLGCLVPGIVITDKECVDKTFPEFWVSIKNRLGIAYEQLSDNVEPKQATGFSSIPFEERTVLIVGMRGSGKSLMGAALARKLQFAHLDADDAFVKHVGVTIKDYVAANDWKAFRVKEEEVLRAIVAANPRRTVISTGGGLVETPTAQEFLVTYPGLVVQLYRPIEDVEAFLNADTTRANLGEAASDIWKRRSPLYQKAAQIEFPLPAQDSDWPKLEKQFGRFVKRVLKPSVPQVLQDTTAPSFFLSLTFKSVAEFLPLLRACTVGVDAIELRVDLLENQSPAFIKQQIALLRTHTNLPIIYTVRSSGEGGAFAGTEDEFITLLDLGFRLGCEFVDVELRINRPKLVTLLKSKRASNVILSRHVYNTRPTPRIIQQTFRDAALFVDSVEIVKTVFMAADSSDALLVRRLATDPETKTQFKNKPLIAIAAGETGKISRVLNTFMTPVTHPALPIKAAPGQLSVAEITFLRQTLSV